MRLEHNFEVPVGVEQAWQVLVDIERVVPCMPGATLTSHDGDDFTGTVKVKLGPVSLTYKGKGSFTEIDETAHRIRVKASGADSRGAGTASANVTAALVPTETDGTTRVEVVTDLDVTGKAAQFGRGLIGDVSSRLVGQFADCLAGKLAADQSPSAADEPAPAGGSTVGGSGPASDTAEPAEGGPAAPERVVPLDAAATGTAGAAPGAAAGGVSTAVAARAVPAEPPVEAEPIDLLAVAGVGSAVRRALPYVATAAAGFIVVLSVIWWIKRR